MFNNLQIFLLALLWAATIGGITFYLIKASSAITYITLADGRKERRVLPFLIRILMPFAQNLAKNPNISHFKSLLAKTSSTIATAGYDGIISATEFLAIRILVPAVYGIALLLLILFLYIISPDQSGNIFNRLVLLAVAIFIYLCLYPELWLKTAIKKRHKKIIRALPFVIDLLTLSVEAGLDFMSAIKNIVQKKVSNPLIEELSRVLLEIQLGKTRKQALESFAERIAHPDITSLTSALVQADELGVSIGTTLRIQSSQLLTKRFMRAEKQANEAPMKLLFPLIVFIFPCVFLILLTPLILQILKTAL
jgi:pilus assembly protein TadC